MIWTHGKSDSNKFLIHYPSRHAKIKSNIVFEENQQRPFLDALLFKKEDYTLGHTIYIKKTSNETLLERQIKPSPFPFPSGNKKAGHTIT